MQIKKKQKLGALVDVVDYDRCSPLHNAAFSGRVQVLKFLLEQGAKVNLPDIDEATPLQKAVFNGHTGKN